MKLSKPDPEQRAMQSCHIISLFVDGFAIAYGAKCHLRCNTLISSLAVHSGLSTLCSFSNTVLLDLGCYFIVIAAMCALMGQVCRKYRHTPFQPVLGNNPTQRKTFYAQYSHEVSYVTTADIPTALIAHACHDWHK